MGNQPTKYERLKDDEETYREHKRREEDARLAKLIKEREQQRKDQEKARRELEKLNKKIN